MIMTMMDQKIPDLWGKNLMLDKIRFHTSEKTNIIKDQEWI
jgi:hypothetical protein